MLFRSANLQTRYPGLEVVGAESPPFRPLTTEESDAIAARIEAADPHVVWVGISTPKQDRWMAAHAPRLPKTVFIGVGAAFDFQVDKVKRAPRWMQRNGMEWFYRLMSEPRRLWQRYLILGPRFAIEVAREARRSRGVRKRSCRSLDSI